MHQSITALPSCVHSTIFWFIPTRSLSSWLSTCSSNLSTSLQHPSSDSWRLRTLRSFGGELAELGPSDPSDPSEWRRRFLRLARACHVTSNLKDLAKNNRLSKEMFLRREFQLGETPTWDLELQWSLVVPTPDLEAASILCYDGASCQLCDVNRTSTTCLWKSEATAQVEPLRAVVATDSIYLLSKSDRVDIYDFNGAWTGDLLPNLVEADLLSSTDMFLADGKLVLEQPTRLLVWDTNSGDFGIIIPRPSIIGGQEEKLHPVQARSSGASTLALWAEEGGRSIHFWRTEPECTQLTQWIPLLPLPSRDTITLITFGVSVGEGLLVALDTAHVLHVAKMIHDADGVQVKDIMVSPIFVESPITSTGEPSILPCSVAVRCGVLCFVEAPNLEAQKRTLHIWQLASEGEILPVPRRQTFQFFTRGQAAVSVPKPIFGRFVILKNCCMMEDGEPLLWIEILDIRQVRQEQEKHPKLRKLDKPSGLYQVLTSARDSTLFRRGHPLTDFLLGFWNEEPDTCFRKLLLVNLARAEDCQKCGAESQPGSTQSGSLESSPCGK